MITVACVGIRLASPRLHSSRLPWQIVLHHARPLSTSGLQRVRSPFSLPEQHGLRRQQRNYWWSSKSPAPAELLPVPEAAADAVTVVPPEPLVPELPVETVTSSSVTDVVSIAGPAVTDIPAEGLVDLTVPSSVVNSLQYGDLGALGLTGWSPAGLCRWIMELIQVSTGLPWFWTIISITVLSRLFLFPFAVRSIRNTARMQPYQKELAALREEMSSTKTKRDPVSMQRSMLKQKLLYEKMGVKMSEMIISPFVQLPVTLGMFFGVKKLCDLPVEQLKHSGLDILPDLTIADPTYFLPVASAIIMNVQLKMGMKDMAATPALPHMINFFRLLSVASVFFVMNLPSGVLVYLVTSLSCMLIQSILLRQPAVRKFLGIPIIAPHLGNKTVSFKESLDYLKKWWEDKKMEATLDAKSRKR